MMSTEEEQHQEEEEEEVKVTEVCDTGEVALEEGKMTDDDEPEENGGKECSCGCCKCLKRLSLSEVDDNSWIWERRKNPTKYLYMALRAISMFLVVQSGLFTFMMLLGTTINYMVSALFVLVGVEQYGPLMILTFGLVVFLPHLVTVFFWFVVDLIKTELYELKTDIDPFWRNHKPGRIIISFIVWIFFIALFAFCVLSVVDGTWYWLVAILASLVCFIIALWGLFGPPVFRHKSIVIVIIPAIVSIIACLIYSDSWLNRILFSFFTAAGVIIILYYFVNSYPCYLYVLLLILLKKCGKNVEIHRRYIGFPFSGTRWKDGLFNIIATVLSFFAFVSFTVFQTLEPWDGLNLGFYIGISALWFFHMVLMWIVLACVSLGNIEIIPDKSSDSSNRSSDIEMNETSSAESEPTKIEKKKRKKKKKKKKTADEKKSERDSLPWWKLHLHSTRKDKNDCLGLTLVAGAVGVGLIAMVFAFSPEANTLQAMSQTSDNVTGTSFEMRAARSERVLGNSVACGEDGFGFTWLDYSYMSKVAYESYFFSNLERRSCKTTKQPTERGDAHHGGAIIHKYNNGTEIIVSVSDGSNSCRDVFVTSVDDLSTSCYERAIPFQSTSHSPVYDGSEYVYFMERSDNDANGTSFGRLDLSTFKFEELASLPNKFKPVFGGCYDNGFVYAIDNAGKLWAYNTATNSWGEKSLTVSEDNVNVRLLSDYTDSKSIYAVKTGNKTGLYNINLDSGSVDLVSAPDVKYDQLREALLVRVDPSEIVVVISLEKGVWHAYSTKSDTWLKLLSWTPCEGNNDHNYLVYSETHDAFFFRVDGLPKWEKVLHLANTFDSAVDLLKKSGVNVLNISNKNPLIHYTILEQNSTGNIVFSFRGTFSKMDAIHDVKNLVETAIPKLATAFFPVTVVALDWFTDVFSYTGSNAFPGGMLNLVNLATEVVESFISEKNITKDKVVCTGHSLGGGLAIIVGTRLGINAYGISPPGSELGRRLYSVSYSGIAKYVHALVPQRDPVAALGSFQGSVQHLPCHETNSFTCHYLDTSICMVSSICGQDNDELRSICEPRWNHYPEDHWEKEEL